LVICALFSLSSLAEAAAGQITEVFADNTNHQLDIVGNDFGSNPSATFGGAALTIVSASATNIITNLPSVPPGTYLLKLSTSTGSNTFDVALADTVGAARVVDSTGKTVGSFLVSTPDGSGYQGVSVTLGASSFVLAMNPNGPVSAYPGVFFQSTNCSGTPYGLPYFGPPVLDEAIFIDGLIYYPTGAAAKVVTLGSNKTPGLCTQASFTSTARPFATIDFSSLGFTPPFHVQ
jgi:hypothetical protein